MHYITWKLNYNYHLQLCNNHNQIRIGSKVPHLTRTKTIYYTKTPLIVSQATPFAKRGRV